MLITDLVERWCFFVKKLLIAATSEVFASALADSAQTMFDIRICYDGITALRFLKDFQPDALVISLSLPCCDGITVLKESAFRPSSVLALTTYSTSYIESTLASLGVGYIMINTATVQSVFSRLTDMVALAESPITLQPLRAGTEHHLHALGFTPEANAYRQLCAGVPLFAADRTQLLTRVLYPAIAEACGNDTAEQVEHSIRREIRQVWSRRNDAVWKTYFPPDPDGSVRCPTNKQFLAALANLL